MPFEERYTDTAKLDIFTRIRRFILSFKLLFYQTSNKAVITDIKKWFNFHFIYAAFPFLLLLLVINSN